MADAILQFKPSLYSVSLDLNRLVGKLFGKGGSAAAVCRRFLEIIQAHGVGPTQIQRLFPDFSLDKLEDEKSMLAALTPSVLERAAALFGIRQDWLEGTCDQIYAPLFCGGTPKSFLQDFAAPQRDESAFPVRALHAGRDLDCWNEHPQPVVLVLVERIAQLGEKDVNRYRIYRDEWDWSYLKCRIQLKAMIRAAYLGTDRPIPLYRIPSHVLTTIREGKLVPHAALQGCLLTEPTLEDFCLSVEESAVAKEVEELPSVLEYAQSLSTR